MLLRAWSNKEKEMYHPVDEDCYWVLQNLGKGLEWRLLLEGDGDAVALVSNEDGVLMYSFGVKGNRGEDVFTGDILLIPDTSKQAVTDDGDGPVEPFNHLAEVILKDGVYGVEIFESGDCFHKGFYSFPELNSITGQTEFEVIGNVHEHDELSQKPDEDFSKKDGSVDSL